MFEITVGPFFAALAIAFYLIIRELSKPDGRGRARWRSLITPTPLDAFSTTDRNPPTPPSKAVREESC